MIRTYKLVETGETTQAASSTYKNIRLPSNYLRIRRVAELCLIFITAPLWVLLILLAAVLVWMEDRRAVFFIQKRPGRDGELFNLYKLRSMRRGSDIRLISGQKDSRVTKVGWYLRKYRIDELPQVLNVIRGQMSIIGPRPVPEHYYKLYLQLIPDYDLRHMIRPGMTGLAQVELGYTTSVEQEQEKLRYDLSYIKNISPSMDLKIILKTFLR